ncbi:MAG: Crp/Fnr family transcriptional regulator [Bacteroidetes bacterium]|nr:Crp/Fnr family transcriptional regulator [Bacteroidota bacterium]MBS1541270.1 Crp/Fnr family transcriptional regulator [Bacteroidota bacterium]
MSSIRHDCITCKVRGCSILCHCDTHTLATISTYKIPGSLIKGEKLFSEGDPVKGVYFIKSGFLKVELNGKHGRPLVLQFAGKGTMFGHRTNLSHSCHTTSAVAVTGVQYCYIPSQAFIDIVCNSSVLKQQILNQILNELDLVEKKVINLAHKTVREKIAAALLLIADVYEYEQKRQSFRICFCRQDIADLAGTTKEQVSKTLKDFEKEKLIRCTAKKFSYLHINSLRVISENHPLSREGS